MKYIQYTYPFLKNPILIENISFLQIGVHKPWIKPLSETNNFTIPIKINEQNYSLTDKDILEFYDLYYPTVQITIDTQYINDPYLIIDIAYEIAD